MQTPLKPVHYLLSGRTPHVKQRSLLLQNLLSSEKYFGSKPSSGSIKHNNNNNNINIISIIIIIIIHGNPLVAQLPLQSTTHKTLGVMIDKDVSGKLALPQFQCDGKND